MEKGQTLDVLLTEHVEWATENLPMTTAIGQLVKAQNEIDEVAQEIGKHGLHKALTAEYVDVFFCLINSAHKNGISVEGIVREGYTKLEVNKSRTWQYNGNGNYSHVK